MFKCEVCGKECKNKAGLAGHKQLKHGLKPSADPLQISGLELEGSSSSKEDSPFTEEVMEALISSYLWAMGQLIANPERQPAMEEQLDLVHEAARQAGPKHHDHLNCEHCDSLIAQVRTAALERVVQYYENISGITELREEAELNEGTITLLGDGWTSQKTEEDIWAGLEFLRIKVAAIVP